MFHIETDINQCRVSYKRMRGSVCCMLLFLFTWLLVRSIARMYRKRSNKHHIRLIESVYTFHVGQINRNQQIKDGNTRRVRSIGARSRSQFIENAKHLR